jgi:hypothetical protein
MSKELTQEQCNELHEAVISDIISQQANLGGVTLPIVITCHKCDARFTCPYAYDWYNTDGDCLAEK